MTALQKLPGRRRVNGVLADEGGAAAVEFAMIVSVLLLLAGGGYDASRLTTARRDAERVAVEVSQTLAACTTSPCVLKAGQAIISRQDNAFLTTAKPTIGWAAVSRVNGTIVVGFGNMTYLPADLQQAALAALPNDNDNGVCSLVKANISSIGIVQVWSSSEAGNQRYFMCTLQSKDVKVV